MKLYFTIIILITVIFLSKAQNFKSKLLPGIWDIQKTPTQVDLFASVYSFEFNKDNTFNILKLIEGLVGIPIWIDESGRYRLIKDSIEITILREDVVALNKPQIIKLKILKLTTTELINQNGKRRYPELKFIEK